MVADFQDRNSVIGGDCITCMNPFYDKNSGSNDNILNYSECLTKYITEYYLMAVWRSRNSDSRQFTWHGMTRAGLVQSHLDLFLTSAHNIYEVDYAEIILWIISAYNIINIKFLNKGTEESSFGISMLVGYKMSDMWIT